MAFGDPVGYQIGAGGLASFLAGQQAAQDRQLQPFRLQAAGLQNAALAEQIKRDRKRQQLIDKFLFDAKQVDDEAAANAAIQNATTPEAQTQAAQDIAAVTGAGYVPLGYEQTRPQATGPAGLSRFKDTGAPLPLARTPGVITGFSLDQMLALGLITEEQLAAFLAGEAMQMPSQDGSPQAQQSVLREGEKARLIDFIRRTNPQGL